MTNSVWARTFLDLECGLHGFDSGAAPLEQLGRGLEVLYQILVWRRQRLPLEVRHGPGVQLSLLDPVEGRVERIARVEPRYAFPSQENQDGR